MKGKVHKVFSAGLWVWIVLCLVTPYLPHQSLIHNTFTYAPPILLCLPLFLAVVIMLIRAGMRRFNRLDLFNLSASVISGLLILGFQFHMNGGQTGSLHILTINVEMTNSTVPGLKEAILDRKIDLVMMQEVKGGDHGPAQMILKDFPSWHITVAGEVAILSRWAFSDVRTFPLRSLPGRYILAARVNAPKPFTAVTTHWSVPQISKGFKGLTSTISNQIHDSEDTLGALDKLPSPLILGGDFNNPPRQGLGQMLSNRMTDAFSAAGNGFGWTYSSSRPVVRIDHLYSTAEFSPMVAEVGPSFGSDHYSLYAEYDWSGQ